MNRLTTLALLAGMLSAPALHSEEPGSGAAAPLSFPQLKGAADSEPGDEPPAASPEELSRRIAARYSWTEVFHRLFDLYREVVADYRPL